jgi:hypothetical protein
VSSPESSRSVQHETPPPDGGNGVRHADREQVLDPQGHRPQAATSRPDGISGQVTNGFRGGFDGILRIEDCSIHGNGDGETFRQLVGAAVHAGDNHISRHPPSSGCPSDLNGDGRVDAADLGLLIATWGFCP